jgi:N-carbamoylputrescine amidase
LQPSAKELGVVIPVSIFERANNAFFNTLVMIDADGEILGCYQKSRIPDAFGNTGKYFFSPGDTGITAWNTRFCRLAVPVCWDQWFPETASIATLNGAQIILHPTAIRTDPNSTDTLVLRYWQRIPTRSRRRQRYPHCGVQSHRFGAKRKLRYAFLRFLVYD